MTLSEDTLKKFGESFQNKSISVLLLDDKYAETTVEIIKEEFFESEMNKWLVRHIKEFYEKYGNTPTIESLSLMIKKEFNDDIRQKVFLDHLKKIFDLMKSKDMEYIKEQFKEFCKNQNMKSAIMQSVDLLKIGKYTDIQSIMNDALNAGEETSIGHFYKDEVEKRMERELRTTTSTGLPEIDQIMGGGLAAGELGCFIGGPGAGKSWILAGLGLAAMKEGQYVAHYTLELNDFYTAHRYDTILTGIELQDLHIPQNRKIIEKAVKDVPGNLIVTKYPTKFATPFTILNHQKRLKNLGIKIGMIIIDYADLLSAGSGHTNDNSYETSGTIYESLRGIAGELNVPMWTVSQVGRAGSQDSIIEADKIAESYKKVMTADFVGSLSRMKQDKVDKTGRIHIIKNRFGPDGQTYSADMDTSTGYIKIKSELAYDDISGGSSKQTLSNAKKILNTNTGAKEDSQGIKNDLISRLKNMQ